MKKFLILPVVLLSLVPTSAFADSTFFNPSLDGYVEEGTNDSSFSVMVNAAGDSANHTNTTARIGYGVVPSDMDFLDRIVVCFDTSSIPDTHTVTGATLQFYESTGGRFNGTNSNYSLRLVSHLPASYSALSASDYGIANFGNDLLSASTPSLFSDAVFTLNDDGFAEINKTGVTCFGVMLNADYDVSDVDRADDEYAMYYMTESGNEPELTVYHGEEEAPPYNPPSGTGSLFGSGALLGVSALCNGYDTLVGTTQDETGTYETTMEYCSEWAYLIEKPMLEFFFRSGVRIVFDAVMFLLVVATVGWYLIFVVYKFFFSLFTRRPVRASYDKTVQRALHKLPKKK